jgi:hypothetical protein
MKTYVLERIKIERAEVNVGDNSSASDVLELENNGLIDWTLVRFEINTKEKGSDKPWQSS